MDTAELIERTYRGFNERDIDGVLAVMTEDVDWPNAWEGGRVVGHEGVREYWSRQWGEIDPTVEPEEIEELPDGRVSVRVHQVVRTLDGEETLDAYVFHVYTLRDGLITRMDVVEDIRGA
jgi:ketosteroid isomerase-like protein